MKKLGDFTRVEVIDHTGRAYVLWRDYRFEVSVSEQDDARTLKVFIGQPIEKLEQPHVRWPSESK